MLLYLGIVKKFEPLLLVGIAFGCLLSNLPLGGLYHQELWDDFMNEGSAFYHSYGHVLAEGGLLDFFYIGVKTSLYPCLIFLGVGAMTDFGPLLSNPKSMLMGAAAQLLSLIHILDIIDTAISPFSGGTSQPATETLVYACLLYTSRCV